MLLYPQPLACNPGTQKAGPALDQVPFYGSNKAASYLWRKVAL